MRVERENMERRETYLTVGGLAKLEDELDHLRTVRRQEAAQRIQHAKEIGGTVDNADYEEAKNEQAFIEGRILTVEGMIKSAVVIPDDRVHSDKVEVGSAVTVVNPQGKTQTYHIVGSTEADPSQGMISNESPVGRALLGHKVGDEAEVTTPAGTIKLSLVKVE
jgi:transcription elongation factor GreA